MNTTPETMNAIAPHIVDTVFPVHGDAVHVGYAYPLFSALCYRESLKLRPDVWVGPIENVRSLGHGMLGIKRDSVLRIRSMSDDMDWLRAYSGADLLVGGHRISLGKPAVRQLRPAPTVHAELVTYAFCKGGSNRAGYDWSRFAERVSCDLARYGGRIHIGRVRKLTISKRFAIGHSIEVSGLSPDASRALQATGSGGRRHFGAGVFIPGPLPKGLR